MEDNPIKPIVYEAILPAVAGVMVNNGVLSYAHVRGLLPTSAESVDIRSSILKDGEHLPYDLLGKWSVIAAVAGVSTAGMISYFLKKTVPTSSVGNPTYQGNVRNSCVSI